MTSSSRRPPRDTSHRLAVVTGKFPSVCVKSDHRYPPQGHYVKNARKKRMKLIRGGGQMQFSNRTQGKHPDNNSESEGIKVDQIEISEAQVVYFHACEGSKDMQT